MVQQRIPEGGGPSFPDVTVEGSISNVFHENTTP